DRGPEHGKLPVHPFRRARARAQVLRLEHGGLMLGCEVAHDRIRFPQQEAVVFLERRHEAVRVHRQVGGLAVLAERAADVDALVLEPHFADRPHHLLHVRRGGSAPDLHVVSSVFFASWPGLSRPSTSFCAAKTWMPGTGPGMTLSGW